jgi:predicted short-subunit dehydrogenase-like oxidoreductase (DUF2520 family)
MSQKPAITIIGTGAVGSVLQDFFESEGYFICSLWNRSGGVVNKNSANQIKKPYNCPKIADEVGDWVLITTPDDQIRNVSSTLSELPVNWKTKSVMHTSGQLSSEILHSLSEAGARVVSMHPVQTFKKGDDRERLQNIYLSLEGDGGFIEELIPVIQKMNAKPLFLDSSQKKAMHIAAVFASNYMVALMSTVHQILDENEIEESLSILRPLIEQTLENIFEKGTSEALTGPISRGDSETVKSHLESLSGNRDLQDLYRSLGRVAVEIAKKSGNTDHVKLSEIESILLQRESE